MTRALLVLRPEPGASATAAAARAAGFAVVVAPLFAVRAVDWRPPADRPDALLLTSANAARLGGVGLASFRDLEVYAVGGATAAAARAAGFERVIEGEGDVAAIVARAAGRRLLHLAGREHRAPPGAPVARCVVYASDAVPALPDVAAKALPDAVALLHSPRAAALFASFVPLAERSPVAIAAISAAAREAAGEGWRAAAVAARPNDAALLAATAKLCDHAP